MIQRVILAITLWLGIALPSMAETIISGLSENRVSITTDFAGSKILIYGAIKRDSPAPSRPLEVIVSVEGPSSPVNVWRKDRIFGIWINDVSVEFEKVPSFFAIASTGPLNHILSNEANELHNITIDRVILSGQTQHYSKFSWPNTLQQIFVEALIRVRSFAHKYSVQEGAVELTEQTLFRTDVALPASLTEGEYRVRIFLLRDGNVIATQDRLIGVYRTGLEQLIYTMAHNQPLLYGLIALIFAAVAGWAASAAFRFIR